MELATLTAAGTLIGQPKVVGAADTDSQPSWSPKGRYLAWLNDNNTAEIYDSATAKLTPIHLAASLGFSISADGAGALVASTDPNTEQVQLTRYDRLGHATAMPIPADLASNANVVVGHDLVLASIGSPADPPATPAPLSLYTNGAEIAVGALTPVSFLGSTVTPGVDLAAVRSDDSALAVVTVLGQDAGCASGAVVHVIDVATHSDNVVPLPLDPSEGDDGSAVTLNNASYSPDGVLGGILASCGGGDHANVFIELHGNQWQRVMPGAVIATRGPDGLLASELGSYDLHEYTSVVHPAGSLVITNANGGTTAQLASAVVAAWAPTAVAPK